MDPVKDISYHVKLNSKIKIFRDDKQIACELLFADIEGSAIFEQVCAQLLNSKQKFISMKDPMKQ